MLSDNFADPNLLTLSPSSADEVLYHGKAVEQETGLECELEVIARWMPKQDIRWRAEFGVDLPEVIAGGDGKLAFTLQSVDGYQGFVIEKAHVTSWANKGVSGWLDGGRMVGLTEEPVESVQFRWVNLPDIGGGEPLATQDDSGRRWYGRQRWHLGDWEMTVDPRPGLPEVLAKLKDSYSYAVTHLATLNRVDHQSFTATEVQPILYAYQLAISFALGRYTSPTLAVATNNSGNVLWREWSARRADPIGGVTPWWHITASSLDEVTRLVGRRFLDSQWGRNATHILQGYIASTHGGFVEQRITVGFATIEQLCWQRKVLEGNEDEKKYDRGLGAADRLRGVLVDASVPLSVPSHLPVLQQFAQEGGNNGAYDGPAAVAAVRHRLMHPKNAEDLYDRPGLLVEAWRLLGHYLELLILHWVGYTGKLHDTSEIPVWSGDVRQVPWT
ncbi:hypothetical protein [Candidatus Protofrankia californiensis]|uniref:hypothetical protein n=1 Tax=Candidatus Protofrankia californiensis TaxID=1839754 RepID=UPI001041579A|nr:hypothetical protein [Candidatus Protofrankia californiensis]